MGKAHFGIPVANGHPDEGGDRCRGAFHQHEAQGIQRVLRKQRRADSQSDQGHEQMEDSQRQQHGLGVGQRPPEVPEAAAKTVGKGLEDHHPTDVWREDAELFWEKQAQKQSA